jgi:hypothetical protein
MIIDRASRVCIDRASRVCIGWSSWLDAGYHISRGSTGAGVSSALQRGHVFDEKLPRGHVFDEKREAIIKQIKSSWLSS